VKKHKKHTICIYTYEQVLQYQHTITSDILVLKLISVLVFILFSSQNFYLLSFSFFGSMIILVFI